MCVHAITCLINLTYIPVLIYEKTCFITGGMFRLDVGCDQNTHAIKKMIIVTFFI